MFWASVVKYVKCGADHGVIPLLEIAVACFVEFAASRRPHFLERFEVVAYLFIRFGFAVGDQFVKIFRLAFFETEKLHECFDAFRGNVSLALQNLDQQTCVDIDCGGENPITERWVEEFFQFVKILQEFAVIGIFVDVDFVSGKHEIFVHAWMKKECKMLVNTGIDGL